MKPTLISITSPAEYRRYSNGQITHHVKTEDGRALTVAEVELLRTDPVRFFGTSDNSDSPEAA